MGCRSHVASTQTSRAECVSPMKCNFFSTLTHSCACSYCLFWQLHVGLLYIVNNKTTTRLGSSSHILRTMAHCKPRRATNSITLMCVCINCIRTPYICPTALRPITRYGIWHILFSVCGFSWSQWSVCFATYSFL